MHKVGRVVWVDSTKYYGELVARVGLRMENGERKNCYFKNVKPWGYIREEVDLPDKEWIVDIDRGYESLFDDDLKRVTTTVPEKVNDRNDDDTLADLVDEHWESDIPFYRKLSIIDGISGYIEIPSECEEETNDGIEIFEYEDVDTNPNFEGEIEPRVLMADIEVSVSEDESFEETRKGFTQPINVISCYDTHEQEYSVFFYNKYDSLNDKTEIRNVLNEQLDVSEDVESLDITLIESDSEEAMLSEFVIYLDERGFDLTSGWNWIDFDWDYLNGRLDKITEFSSYHSPFGECYYHNNDMMFVRGIPAFDMMKSFCDKMTFSNWRSKGLDYVSNEEIGVGKIDDVDINNAWENNAEKLIAYNIVDVALTVLLDRSNDIHSFFYEMGDISSIPIYDTFYEKRIVDGYVMSRRKENEILPSAKEAEIPNAGGYVADPINGRNEKVGVSDLKSLYPSAMITWNISTETIAPSPDAFDDYVKVPHVPEPKKVEGKIQEEQIDWDWLYCSLDQEGIIPRTLKKLFDKRNREKEAMYNADTEAEESKWDRKQGATKVIMNSFYGNASSPYWRLSNEYLGDAVTSAARYTLWKGEQTIHRLGYEHLYSDTDSHFVQLKEDSIEAQVEELKYISHEMDKDASVISKDIGIEGVHPFLKGSGLHGDEYTCMLWEPEKIYEIWMQLGKKKRYAGNIAWEGGDYYNDPEISITGLEYQRSDSPEVTAELQQETVEMVLTGSGFEDVSKYIQSVIDQIDKDHEEVRKFALPGSINKDLEDYPNRQVPRACMYSNDHLDYEFTDGDDPFVYLVEDSPPQLPQTDVLALEWNEEIPEGFSLDKEAIVERAIHKPLESVLSEMDWEWNEVRSGKKQETMDLSTGGENPFA